MNYLAHLFLSCHSEVDMIGNFLADMTTLKESRSIPEVYQKGVLMHRNIDRFTDQHPSVKSSINVIRPYQRKYSPVVIDIFFDYLLHKDWDRYNDLSFDDFTTWIYRVLEKHIANMPIRLQPRVLGMVKASWINQYTYYVGLQNVFERLKRRTRFENQLHFAVKHLQNVEGELLIHFRNFFPDVIEHVNSNC